MHQVGARFTNHSEKSITNETINDQTVCRGVSGLTCTKVNSLQLRLLPTEGRDVMASRERTPRPNTPHDR